MGIRSWLRFIANGFHSLQRHPVEDLKSGRVTIDWNELDVRLCKDHPARRAFCKELRFDGPTPCWYPFCDCGDKA